MTAYFKRNTISLPLPDCCYLEFLHSDIDNVIEVDVYEVVFSDDATQKQIASVEDALERDPNCVQFVH